MAEQTKMPSSIRNIQFFVTVYDVFGYLIPGFVFYTGLYLVFVNFRVVVTQVGITGVAGFMSTWYGVMTALSISYITGHLMSALSKLFERVPLPNWLPFKRFTAYLFEGPNPKFLPRIFGQFHFTKRMSEDIILRFCKNYELIVGSEFPYKITCPFYKLKWRLSNSIVRYTDLVWDTAGILLSRAPEQYSVYYNFLALAGFFRTLTVVWLLLLISALFVQARSGFAGAIPFEIVLLTLIGLALVSFSRYVKFGRMHNYQGIRSFANIDFLTNDVER